MVDQTIKKKVKERYRKIALTSNSLQGCCGGPTECCNDSSSTISVTSPLQIARNIGYDNKELESVPQPTPQYKGFRNRF